jgi:serine protease AprX
MIQKEHAEKINKRRPDISRQSFAVTIVEASYMLDFHIRKSVNWGGKVKHLNWLVALALALTLVMPLATVPGPVQAQANDSKADPRLLQQATEHPDDTFMVIVQREMKNKDLKDDDPEIAVEKGGGKVKKQLKIIESFSAELTGKEIVKLAKHPKVRWISVDAPLFSTAVVTSTALDAFSSATFTGSNGTVEWRTKWVELGETDGASAGKVKVATNSYCAQGYCLQIGASSASIEGFGVMRRVDLKYAASATLSFNYRRSNATGTTGSVLVQVSNDLGTTWNTLATINLNATDSSQQTASYDILTYANRKTGIRFIGSGTANRTILIDNVKVDFTVNTNLAKAPNFETVRDDSMSVTYAENAGTENWLSNWVESDAAGTSASSGNIRIVSSSIGCLTGRYCLYVSNANVGDNVYRAADLSRAASARLTFWRNNILNGLNNNDSIVLEVSTGGINWTTLRTWKDVNEDVGAAYESFDLSSYLSANTRIRFRVATRKDNGYINFDNIQIQYTPLVNVYDRAVGADKVWKEPPYLDGTGVTVAVVDSGINPHADLNVSGSGNSRIITATSTITTSLTSDGYGHGTHVAGIITGNGNKSNNKRSGIAPGVNLINVRVADDNGMGYGSDLVDGLQWIYDNRAAYNIKVVNISMNSSIAEPYHTSAIDAAVEILWFNGIVVVVSAGNSGSGVLYPPANDPFVITVGAMDDMGTAALTDDVVASFSAYGLTEDGFAKPDLVAPGRNIISLLAGTSARAYIDHPDFRVDDFHFRMSGTSMSAPMVSGAAALLLQDEPALNPDQVKYRLMATANNGWACSQSSCPLFDMYSYGAGYLDIDAAIHGTTTQTANTGITVSNMLTTGSNPINWGSVQWGSVQWGSVQWGSVQWGSDYWGP